MALKIIKRFLTILALVQSLAGGTAKLADEPGIMGMTQWAFNAVCGYGEVLIGGSNAVCNEFTLPRFTHPISRPGGGKNRRYGNVGKTMLQQCHADIHRYHIHGRATAISGGNNNFYMALVNFHVPYNAQVYN